MLTGSRVDDRIEKVIGFIRERSFKQFIGPKASNASNPGYRATPIRRGVELFELSLSDLIH